jgi:allantoin racemase
VPVLNPGLIAFKTCETLVELGLAHSKRAYPSPRGYSDAVFQTLPPVGGELIMETEL